MADSELGIEIRDRIAFLSINRPPLNTLTPNLMELIRRAHLDLASNRDVRGIILRTDNQKFFCNGLDPETMLAASVSERVEIFRILIEMSVAMYSFPKLQLAAIKGHAMAGGAVLGILCDLRFMAEGKGRYSFSEVRVGLTLPEALLGILEGVIGPQHLRDVAMLGEAYTANDALAIGLVDRVLPAATLDDESERHLKQLFEIPQTGMGLVKHAMRKKRLERLRDYKELSKLEPLLSGNFEEGLRAVLERRRPRFQEDA